MRATVFTTTDRIEAQALVALLRGAGIDAELSGVVDAARVGVGDAALPLRIEVDAEDEAQARDVLAAKPEPEPEAEERPPLSRKRPIIAVGVPVVWPGLGHVYAGRPYTGVLLMLGVVLSFIGAAANSQVGAAYAVLLVLDAFFGRRAVLAFNVGKHRSAGAQLAAGFAMVLAAFVLTGAGPAVDAYRKAMERRELARIEVLCSDAGVTLTNVGDARREVEVTSVESVSTALFAVADSHPVAVRGERRKTLEPSQKLELELEPSLRFAMLPTLQSPRGLRIQFVVRRDTGESMRGSGYCDAR